MYRLRFWRGAVGAEGEGMGGGGREVALVFFGATKKIIFCTRKIILYAKKPEPKEGKLGK